MSSINKKDILAALTQVQEPQSGKDLVALNMVKNVEIDGPRVSLTVEFQSASYPFKEKVQANAKAAVMTISGVEIVTVNVISEPDASVSVAFKNLTNSVMKQIDILKAKETDQGLLKRVFKIS